MVAGYGEFMILNNLSFKAARGKITLLLGPNGAGKSTVLKTLFGLLKVRQGRVTLDGQDITGASAQGAADAARHRLRAAGAQPVRPAHRLREPRARRHHAGHEDRRASASPRCSSCSRASRSACTARPSSLSGGEQKQLEVGRALLLRPKVLLIDEPSIGLSPLVVQDVFQLLRRLADGGTTVLMVEQNVKSALKMADEAIALESGRLVLHKPADELLADPHIERLFLGGAHAVAAVP